VRKIALIALVAVVACFATSCEKEFGFKKIAPPTGVMGGGEPVTISGSGFQAGMGISVYFGTDKAGNVVINSPEKMTVTTPSSFEPKTVDVRILTDTGQEYVIRRAFSYIKQSHMDIRDLGKRKSMRKRP
jgi:hypothetical protein